MKRSISLLLLLSLCLLMGCGEKADASNPTPSASPAPAQNVESTPTPAQEPAPENQPTPSPEPMPTPAPLQLLQNGTPTTSLTLYVGTEAVLTIEGASTEDTISYSCDNQSVAQVDANGKIVALGEGSATIQATMGERTGLCKLTVWKPAKTTVAIYFMNQPITDFTMNASANETIQLRAVTTPADTGSTITWTSTDPAIAEIDNTGHVKAISQGSCEVVCQCGESSARCWVRVKGQRINYETVDTDPQNTTPAIYITCAGYINPDFTLVVGESVNMDYKLVNAEEGMVSWSIANPAVASVDQNGVVTALKAGTTTLSVTCGSLSFSSTVRVKE